MITIKNVKNLDGETIDFKIASMQDQIIDANGLVIFPGLIDSHISLGSPQKDSWQHIIKSAVRGGVTTIIDLPSREYPTEGMQELEQKRQLVDKFLRDLKIPLDFYFYSKGNSEFLEEMGLEKSMILGSLILFYHDSHVLDDKIWDRIFQIAAWEDLPVILNSKNENVWNGVRFKGPDETLLEKAIYYAERQNTRLYVMNVATKDELELIKQARERTLLIYAETTPAHLFPSHEGSQPDFLWEAIERGNIEIVGSGYHVEDEGQERMIFKEGNFDVCNPMFLLPFLLTAYHAGKISLERIVHITRGNLYEIFQMNRKNNDVVLVNLEEEQTIQRLKKKDSIQLKLKGFPAYTIVKGQIFIPPKSGYQVTRIE